MKVKICGLRRRTDVLVADRLGADYLGVIVSAGFGRSVSPAEVPALVEGVRAVPVAVLVDEDVDTAARLGSALGAGVLQLHGDESPAAVRALRDRGPWRIWKSVRARHPDDLARALDGYGGDIDGILIEGFREGVVGGGGARLDLDAFVDARAAIPPALEVVLAGGLTPDGVHRAVARFAPDVVDVSSGVERIRGEKDPDLVRRFIEEAKRDEHASPSASQPDPQGETP